MATRSRAASSASESDYDMVLHPGVRSDAASASSEQLSAAQGNSSSVDCGASICSSDLANMVLDNSRLPSSTPLSPIEEDDIFAVGQAAPRVPGRDRDIHLNLMLLGESGLGKTTFIYQLLHSYAPAGADIRKGHDGSSTTMDQFKRDPSSLCTELRPVHIPNKNLRLLMKLQDMPGWGDDINVSSYARTVAEYVIQQRAADYDELQGHRSFPKANVSGCLKNSVTACLYFLPPHRTKPIDLILMSTISQLVVVIPVIAKADTMTEEETEKYRQEILERCLDPGSYIARTSGAAVELRMNFFNFDIDDLKALGVQQPVPPFTLITSEHFDENSMPVRQYLWGKCNAAKREHSDFILLKRLLLGDKVNSLWQLLDDAYDRYVDFCGVFETTYKSLDVMTDKACEACGPHLEYEHYHKSQTQLRQLQEQHLLLKKQLAAARKGARCAWMSTKVLLLALVSAAYVHVQQAKVRDAQESSTTDLCNMSVWPGNVSEVSSTSEQGESINITGGEREQRTAAMTAAIGQTFNNTQDWGTAYTMALLQWANCQKNVIGTQAQHVHANLLSSAAAATGWSQPDIERMLGGVLALVLILLAINVIVHQVGGRRGAQGCRPCLARPAESHSAAAAVGSQDLHAEVTGCTSNGGIYHLRYPERQGYAYM